MPDITVNIANTPGIYYAVAYWLGCLLYIRVNSRKLNGWPLLGVQLFFLLAIGSFMLWTDGVPIYLFIPCVLVVIYLMFLLIMVCCDMKLMKVGYFCIRAFILGEFAASLVWQIYYHGLRSWNFPNSPVFALLFLIIMQLAVFAIMYALERKYSAENAQLQINVRELVSALLIGTIIYAISNLSYVFENSPFSSSFPTEIFIIRTMVDLGGVGILFAYHMQLRELKVKIEMEQLENMLKLQYEHYQISEKSIALVNQKYHDLKHQIELLRQDISSEDKLQFLDQIEQDIKSYEAQNKTGNKVLDTILTTKSLECQDLGISLTCVADGKELSFMHPIDLSAVFGNALDNAIESVKKVSDPDKKLIHVSVARQKSFLCIRIENFYEGEIYFQNGMPATTKKNKQFHGIGIKSIKTTVEKYNGSMTIGTKNNWFELRILFPVL